MKVILGVIIAILLIVFGFSLLETTISLAIKWIFK